MQKDTFYFSHDYTARTDPKIKHLLVKLGYLGYGVFWAIVEDLYNNANALPTDYDSIAFDLHTDVKVIKSIINDFDLFVIKDGFFGSMSIQKRLELRNKKSQKARESAFKRWNKDANAMQTQCECNAIKERKGKKSKINNKFIIPTIIEVKNYCDERKNKINPQSFIDHYTSNGWMVGKNKMKDWMAAVRTWEKNNFETEKKQPEKNWA